jgi:hypothetical protein
MQQYTVQQEQQTCILHEDKQHFIEEISALRSLVAVAGVAGHFLVELDDLKYQVEQLDSRAWEQQAVRVRQRDELVRLSLAVLRAFNARSGDASGTD